MPYLKNQYFLSRTNFDYFLFSTKITKYCKMWQGQIHIFTKTISYHNLLNPLPTPCSEAYHIFSLLNILYLRIWNEKICIGLVNVASGKIAKIIVSSLLLSSKYVKPFFVKLFIEFPSVNFFLV